jgi:hypothetical protein
MRVLSNLFDNKHCISPDLATLEQVKMLTFLAYVIHRLVFVNNNPFETIFQGLHLYRVKLAKPIDLANYS